MPIIRKIKLQWRRSSPQPLLFYLTPLVMREYLHQQIFTWNQLILIPPPPTSTQHWSLPLLYMWYYWSRSTFNLSHDYPLLYCTWSHGPGTLWIPYPFLEKWKVCQIDLHVPPTRMIVRGWMTVMVFIKAPNILPWEGGPQLPLPRRIELLRTP